MKLYQLLPINTYYYLRFLKDFLNQKDSTLTLSSKPKFWFLDAPSYGNLGDQAIAYSCICFLKENFPDRDIVEVLESQIISRLNWVKKHIRPKDIIILNGGGNLGDLYPRYEFIRRQIISSFPNNQIIIFPQSIYFSDTGRGYREREITSKIYGKHSNLLICARDSKSAGKMKELFSNNNIILCPDMVFYLMGKIPLLPKQNLAGICLREDGEKTLSDGHRNKILDYIKVHFPTVTNISTLSKHERIDSSNRKELVVKKIQEFSICKFIATDRLHGLIFSYIAQTPCLLISSSTNKTISLYHDWLNGKDCISIYKNGEDIYLPKTQNNKPLDFSELIRVIRSLINKEAYK